MKKILLFTFTIFIVIACSEDPASNNVDDQRLVGKWQLDQITVNDEITSPSSYDINEYPNEIIFYSDAKFKIELYMRGEFKTIWQGKWRCEDDKLILSDEGGDEDPLYYAVEVDELELTEY